MSTRERILVVSLETFSERGVVGTSLDELARRLGVTKQTILYHFGSKEELVDAVVRSASGEVRQVVERALEGSAAGWPRVEAAVRAVFALAVRRPALLGLLREVSRVGRPHSVAAAEELEPLIERSLSALAADGTPGPAGDPRLLLASAYALTTGVITDTEVLSALGVSLDLRVAAQLRRTVLEFLRAALDSTAFEAGHRKARHRHR